jgi:hypothetical protein
MAGGFWQIFSQSFFGRYHPETGLVMLTLNPSGFDPYATRCHVCDPPLTGEKRTHSAGCEYFVFCPTRRRVETLANVGFPRSGHWLVASEAITIGCLGPAN